MTNIRFTNQFRRRKRAAFQNDLHRTSRSSGAGVAAGANFLPGLRAAMAGSGAAELLGAFIAFAFIRRDSLYAKK
jgi:hypothetical protein